ncbi:MAG TPA: hypothetical protein VHB21_22175 [Minicystis sp.]|nr:hypothetical protein [Minicystis sp.]
MAMTPEERRTLAGCVFAGGCICMAPGEFRAGGFLIALSLLLTARHVWLARREDAAAPKPPPPRDAHGAT